MSARTRFELGVALLLIVAAVVLLPMPQWLFGEEAEVEMYRVPAAEQHPNP
jgi:hypothetical protein